MAKNTFKSELFLIFMVVIAVAGQVFFQRKMTESMANLLPGTYPESVDEPILINDFPVQKNAGYTKNGSEQNWPFYPVFGSSYDQFTNNVRYWATPNNGQCSPAGMCGGIYDNKTPNISSPPPMISLDCKKTRVNYYNSKV
jgi:hypothetical protein